MVSIAILAVVIALAAALFHPAVANNRTWRAIVTPLASIIGSGFLVIGPLLDYNYGYLAPIVMAGLCLTAYLFGGAIRRNIAELGSGGWQPGSAQAHIETASSWVLAFSYVISVAYYLNLFGAFAVSMTGVDSPYYARLVTTAMLVFLLLVGSMRGFSALEGLEQVTVSIKLAIIGGLLLGIAWYFAQRAATQELVINPPYSTGWSGVTLALGLIVTVQGFETSRYLGEEYDPRTRITSMRQAQWISSMIYIAYIGLLAFCFPRGVLALEETAIISLMEIVAPILPLILIAGALAAQFSAATADMAGSGGLVSELTGGRISSRVSYAVLAATGIVLTWQANVFENINGRNNVVLF